MFDSEYQAISPTINNHNVLLCSTFKLLMSKDCVCYQLISKQQALRGFWHMKRQAYRRVYSDKNSSLPENKKIVMLADIFLTKSLIDWVNKKISFCSHIGSYYGN